MGHRRAWYFQLFCVLFLVGVVIGVVAIAVILFERKIQGHEFNSPPVFFLINLANGWMGVTVVAICILAFWPNNKE